MVTIQRGSRVLRAAPALAALAYPAIVWAGPAVSPIFLLVALAVPALAVVVAHRIPAVFPWSRVVALAAVTAPPLFSWLGGLLDFQTTVAVHALGVWLPLWTALLAGAVFERPAALIAAAPRRSRLSTAHGVSASLVTVFAVAHILNHLTGLWGGATHIAVMHILRGVYRAPAVEIVLLTAVAFQVLSGLRLLAATPVAEATWPDTLQRASGAYLAVFFLSHLTAALRARHLRGIDTNWIWLTSDSMLTDPWSARLAPYYFLGIVALGVHGGVGLRHVLIAHGVAAATADRVAVSAGAGAAAVSAVVIAGLLRA